VKIIEGKVAFISRAAGERDAKKILPLPSEACWVAFWKEMDELQVWEWSKRYYPRKTDGEVHDAASWLIQIQLFERRVDSRGEGVYPADKDLKHPEPNFRK
jgi:hypothetical protein